MKTSSATVPPLKLSAARKRSIRAWALYDAGNSAFATVVIAGFFPVCFKSFWAAGADAAVSTARLGLANTVAGCSVALLAPMLGAAADAGRARKRLLGLFTLLGVAATASLAAIASGRWQLAAAAYIAGVIGFSGGNIFYDALLPGLAPKYMLNRISARGYALGYLGGGLLLAGCILLSLHPEWFGIDRTQAVRMAFAATALWWLLFSLPLFRFVPEPGTTGPAPRLRSIIAGLQQLGKTLQAVRARKHIWLFLLAYWCYIDGVHTVIRMAVDYGLALGFSSSDLIAALLITQFIGFPCALAFGRLGTRWDTKKTLLLCIAGYFLIVLWGMRMQSAGEFYILAALVGVFQGGIQALSRSFFAAMIPPGQAGQFFGFFNMVGKWAAIIGPALMGTATVLTGSHRIGIASLLIFFILGAGLLVKTKGSSKLKGEK